ncbi:hypothetical protein CaCOL14_008913 [Colletotrichum acutatum]
MQQRVFTQNAKVTNLLIGKRDITYKRSQKPKEVRQVVQAALLVDVLARWFSLFEHLGH